MKTRKTVALGALIGTAFALMFAPQKGENVRRKLHNETHNHRIDIQPLGRGYAQLFHEFIRVMKTKYITIRGKNPFTVTALKKQ
ncbi:hypothetical protein GF369_01755 [Candidatus Peregrinibacteria bacterium]|nr:hypothetical protein [Candidatus Peregrinibacteria bacterium]